MSFTTRSGRDLPLVVTAKAVSFLGDEVAAIALMLRLQSSGAGPLAIATLLIANLAPIVLLAGPVGQLVDRYDNRRLLVVSSLAQAAVCAVLSFAVSPGLVLPLVAALGAGQAVNGATWQALLPAVVGEARLPRALSLSQGANTVAGIAAPALSGLLTGAFGARVPLLVDAASFVAVCAAALLMHTRRVVTPSAEKLPGGLAVVRRDPLLRTAIGLLALFVLLGSMVNVVEVFLVRETMHASTTWYGVSAAAYAVGLLLGTLVAGRLSGTVTFSRALLVAATLLGVGLAGMGLSPDVRWLSAVAVLAGAMNGVLNICVGAVVMGTAAPEERGRVAAVLSASVSGTQLAAYVAGGTLAGALGPRGVFILAGALAVLAPAATGRSLLRAAAGHGRRGAVPDLAPAASG